MGKIIHNAISAFFSLFVPVVYITFILAGLSCALVSAIIEYEVFSELFKISTSETIILSVPFLVVFAFETTKIFLIFLHKQYTITGNNSYISDRRNFVGLRWVLIIISFIATLIFSFYNLQSPEYDSELNVAKQDVQKQYEFELQELNKSFDNQIASQIVSVDNEINKYDQRMRDEERHKFRNSEEYRGPKYQAAKAEKLLQEQRREAIINSINQDRRIAIDNLNNNRVSKVESKEDALSSFQKAGNKMLLATLRVINVKHTFPDWQYVLAIGLLSLMLSVAMEFIIWSSFTVLAMHHGDIFDFGIQTQKFKTATEASLDIDQTEVESTIEKNRRSARTVFNSIQKQARDTVEKMRKEV